MDSVIIISAPTKFQFLAASKCQSDHSCFKGLLAAHRGGYMESSQREKGPAPLLWRASDSETYADYGMSVCDSQSILSSNSSDTLGSGVLGDKLIE